MKKPIKLFPLPPSDEPTGNPLDGLFTLRGLARKCKRAPTTMSAILRELDCPFLILRNRKLYSLDDLREAIARHKQTLAEGQRRRRSPEAIKNQPCEGWHGCWKDMTQKKFRGES